MYSPHRYFSLKALGLGAALLLTAASGCTQNPPGPTITTEGQTPVVPDALNSAEKAFADYNVLAWEEDFNGNSLNTSNWTPEIKDVWYNNEEQATTNDRKNLTVTGGNLVITAVKESYHDRNYTSARIITKGHKEFTFGRLDIRAKLPKGKGIWPAIWMLGSNDSQVSWPACGEIDIMELRGSQPQVNISTLHYGASVAAHEQRGTTYALPSDDFSTDFHTFTVIRSLDKIRFYVDGAEYFTVVPGDVSVYPFNNPFYLILNVAVGGDFDGPPDGSTTFPQQMLVDYVKYFKYTE